VPPIIKRHPSSPCQLALEHCSARCCCCCWPRSCLGREICATQASRSRAPRVHEPPLPLLLLLLPCSGPSKLSCAASRRRVLTHCTAPPSPSSTKITT
jgi:hypothetical protein